MDGVRKRRQEPAENTETRRSVSWSLKAPWDPSCRADRETEPSNAQPPARPGVTMESPTCTMSSRGQDPSNWNPELGRGTPSQLRAPPAPLHAQMRVCLHPKARQGKAKHLCCWGICSRVGPWVLLGHGVQGRGRPPRLPGHVMLTTEMTGVEKGGEEGGQEGGRRDRMRVRTVLLAAARALCVTP